VSVYYSSKPKNIIANLTKTNGFYVSDTRIDYATGASIHEHKTSVGFWLKDGKNKEKLVISGDLTNNRTTFVAYLESNQETTTPSGNSKNDGFATIQAWTPDDDPSVYYLTVAINHDVEDEITQIHIHAPAPSGANNVILIDFSTKYDQAGRVFNAQINSTAFFWLSNHLGYVNLHTKKDVPGTLRGQIAPLVSPRTRIPVFPNGATEIIGESTITFLPDGSTILGNLTNALNSGGARPSNLTIGTLDDRVAYFFANNQSSFANVFRFPLPVTLANRFNTRGAFVVISAAAEVVDNNKWEFNLYNLADDEINANGFVVEGAGNKTYTTASADLDAEEFRKYLGPGGVFVQLTGTSVSEPLFVDRFYVVYYVASAYSNSIIRDIFFRGSDVQKS